MSQEPATDRCWGEVRLFQRTSCQTSSLILSGVTPLCLLIFRARLLSCPFRHTALREVKVSFGTEPPSFSVTCTCIIPNLPAVHMRPLIARRLIQPSYAGHLLVLFFLFHCFVRYFSLYIYFFRIVLPLFIFINIMSPFLSFVVFRFRLSSLFSFLCVFFIALSLSLRVFISGSNLLRALTLFFCILEDQYSNLGLNTM